jgi:inosose dehydratase
MSQDLTAATGGLAALAERVVVANAPCSYGAFEITVGIDPNVPDEIELMDLVAGAGYAGIDLGPVGYLGLGDELHKRLSSRGLGLAGGYLGLPFSDPERLQAAMPELDALLDVLDSAPASGPRPKPTLADVGSEMRSALPGRSAIDRSVGWDDPAWARFADGLARVAERCRERGYEPTFHHHTATYVEAQWEIEKLLELTDVGVCLDTGHLLLGRGDPVTALRDWGDRINHFHLKDAKLEILHAIVEEAAPVEAIWRRKAFCALGEGDVAIDSVLATLQEIGYAGWIVVEQDILPDADEPVTVAAAQQRHNREFLRERGL